MDEKMQGFHMESRPVYYDMPVCDECGEVIKQTWAGMPVSDADSYSGPRGGAECACSKWEGKVTSFAGSLLWDTVERVGKLEKDEE